MTTGILTQQRFDNFWEKVDKSTCPNGCWLWTGARAGGKGQYGVFMMGWKTLKRSHRLSYEMCYGPIGDGLMVCHTCDTPLCVNPSHLFLGTAKDNTQDMISKGRRGNLRGQANGATKLTDDEVRSIYLDPRTNCKIAADYKISPSLVSQIRLRKIRSEATIGLPNQARRKPGSGSPACQS